MKLIVYRFISVIKQGLRRCQKVGVLFLLPNIKFHCKYWNWHYVLSDFVLALKAFNFSLSHLSFTICFLFYKILNTPIIMEKPLYLFYGQFSQDLKYLVCGLSDSLFQQARHSLFRRLIYLSEAEGKSLTSSMQARHINTESSKCLLTTSSEPRKIIAGSGTPLLPF